MRNSGVIAALQVSDTTTSFTVLGPIFFVMFDILLLISVAALAVSQASLVSRNVTTNELSNWHRYEYLKDEDGDYRNPFDNGWNENCNEVCFPDRASGVPYTLDRPKKPSQMIGERDSLVKTSVD